MSISMTDKVYVIVPALNESTRVGTLISKVRHEGFDRIVVIDDGSDDATSSVALRQGATVLRHPVNLGAGAATQTGLSYAVSEGAEVIVTIDADLQHLPEDIHAVIMPVIQDKADLVIGSRFMKSSNHIPRSRRIYNRIANWITFLVTGYIVTDSQSGFRALSASFAAEQKMNCHGFEFCIEMIRNAAQLRSIVREVPISVRYTRETMQKGQSFLSGVKMIGRLLRLNFLGK